MDEVTLYNLLANKGSNKDPELRERYILLIELLIEKNVINKRERNKLLKGLK